MKNIEKLYNKSYYKYEKEKYDKYLADAVDNFIQNLHQTKITLDTKIPITYSSSYHSYKDFINSYITLPFQPTSVVIDNPGAGYTQLKQPSPFSPSSKNNGIEIDHNMTTEELIYDEIENPGKWGGLDNIRKQKGE